MGDIIQGNNTWSAFSNETLLVRDIAKKIYNEPEFMNLAPFYMLLEALSRGNRIGGTSKAMEYEMVKDDFPGIKSTVSSASTLTSSASTLNIAEKGYFKEGDTIYNITQGEHARVTVAVSGTGAGTMTVILLSGTGAWVADDEVLTLDNTMPEGGTDPSSITTEKDTTTNYCEHFVKGIGITAIANAVETLTEDRINYERRKVMIEYLMAWERKFFFGKKLKTTVGGKNVWHTGGLLDPDVGIPSANKHNLAGALLTKEYFEKEFLLPIFENGGNSRKIGFVSPSAAVRLSELYAGSAHVNITPGMKKKLGISTSVIYTQLGEVELATHYFFKASKIGSPYQNIMLLLDPEYVEKVGLQGMNSVNIYKERQASNVWSQNEVISSIQGLRVTGRNAHGIIHNFAIS